MTDGTFICPHCERPFLEADHRDLHVGRDHTDTMTAEEWVDFEAAREREDEWLDVYARHMRAGLTTLPVLLAWLGVLVLLAVIGGNPAYMAMVTPGVIAFGAIVYYFSYSNEAQTGTRRG